MKYSVKMTITKLSRQNLIKESSKKVFTQQQIGRVVNFLSSIYLTDYENIMVYYGIIITFQCKHWEEMGNI